MRRSDLQLIAQAKIDDAILLLESGRASNSYYLAGYSIEIGLKACIAKQISSDTIPDLAFVRSIYSHSIGELVKVAGLASRLKRQQDDDKTFAANWAIVCEWGPDERYNVIDIGTAQLMISAVVDPKNGVLQWIKAHW